MLRIGRIFVALLLVLALPVQGVAAVAASVCMAMGHHDAGMAHDHAAGHAHDHGAAPHHPHPAESTGEAAHCPPCAACCAAAHMVPAPIALAFALVMPEPLASSTALRIPGFPDELDRPPLSL